VTAAVGTRQDLPVDHDPEPDPRASQQTGVASDSSTVVQAKGNAEVNFHPPGPPPSNAGITAITAITAVAALVVLVVLISSRKNDSSDTGSSAHATTSASPGATPTTSAVPAPSSPSGRVPLFDLTPDSPPVLNDETDTVDQEKDVRIKVARHFCTTGVPTVVTETYDLGGAYTTFIGRVGVDDEPSGEPVTFSVYADGTRVATKTVAIARTEDISADVTGKQKMTLETTTATCATVKAAWVRPALVAR
jgi:NPCBM/NEW2 domain-containing protein